MIKPARSHTSKNFILIEFWPGPANFQIHGSLTAKDVHKAAEMIGSEVIGKENVGHYLLKETGHGTKWMLVEVEAIDARPPGM